MKKTLIWLHKWLGVVLALFFLMWFASGVVLYYVPFPNLTQTERLAGLAPLQLPGGAALPHRMRPHAPAWPRPGWSRRAWGCWARARCGA